ncbi:PAF acetylhydrolase family protein [Penicillium argentinense]|uniref:1-alkyl-2-acetylglycerophosphocholine esterase n=1 Tax=Penicillium argentinense TaxID=1131581 RepID=A0A9W9KEQ4_9EURO|nr:PAF acetylhydrolase family protein [Penicillium argentinense]KAJ5103111.1 PAF acetylhydrolase family protein [Penicillium argentinense]
MTPVLLLYTCLFGLSQASISLPSTTGACDVTLHTSELVDSSRIDPFDPKGGNRSLMITSFTPTNCGSIQSTPYFPNGTAAYEDAQFKAFGLPPGTFSSFQLQSRHKSPATTYTPYPVVLFSPALSTSRLMYTLLLREIASNGLAIVSVDHPYDAEIIEYPDGHTVLGKLSNISTEYEIEPVLNVRVEDMTFLLDQLHTHKTLHQIFPLSKNPHLLSLTNVTIMGHSLGGATAAQTLLLDNRFAGAINLDGTLWGSVVKKGLDKPFMLFGHTNKTQATDPSWKALWPRLKGWKIELELAQSEHYTFSDYPILLDAVNIADAARRAFQARIGTIGALRARDAIVEFTVAAVRYFVNEELGEILRGPSEAWPDISFVSS